MNVNTKKVGKLQIQGTNHCEDFEWEDILDNLTQLMKNTTEWYAEVKNFGWNNSSVYAIINATTGRELLNKILPHTDCSFKIYKYDRNGIAINISHHDSPTGKELYYIVPHTKSLQKTIKAK